MNRYLVACLRALPITLLVFALQLVVSVPIALPLSNELERLLAGPWDGTTQAALLDALSALRPLTRTLGLQLVLAVGAWFAASPVLHVAWLSALSTPMAPGRALRRGLVLLPRSCLLSLLWALGTALLASPFLLAAWACSALFDVESNVRSHDLSLLVTLAPLVLVALVSFTWHDFARARSLEQGFVRSVLRSFVPALRPANWLKALGFIALGTGLVLLADLCVRGFGGSGFFGGLLAGLLVHGAILTKLFLRSLWLCHALAAAEVAEGDDTTVFHRSQP
jgi:hypothetical protein